MMFVLFIVLGIVLPDLYLEKQFPMIFKKQRWLRWSTRLITLLFVLLSVKLFLMVRRIQDIKLATGFMWFVWLWFLFYMPKLLFILISWLRYPFRWIFRKNTSFFQWIGLAVALYAVYFYINGALFGRFDYQVNRVSLVSDRLPKSFDHTKIVQISDIHIGNLDAGDRILAQMVKLINAENADYILQTGDMVNNRAEEIDENSRYFGELRARKGKYAVLGNHDYGDYVRWESQQQKAANLQNLIKKQQDMGFVMLNNQSVVLRNETDSIALIGVENWGEPPFPQHGNLSEAMKGVESIPFKILLTHNPIHWDKEVKNKTDIFLSLSGHTHAMQMVFNVFGYKFSPSVLRYPKWGGLYEENGQYLYVNTGLGYVLMPFRYQCGPEITVFELLSSDKNND